VAWTSTRRRISCLLYYSTPSRLAHTLHAIRPSKRPTKQFSQCPEFLEQGDPRPNGSLKPRRGLEIFSQAMVGGGRVHASPLYVDYPWETLGSATVVDVGGGVGGMSLDLAKRSPQLRFVLQDRAPVIQQAEIVWEREFPEALETRRMKMMEHDFFIEPIKFAEVYLFRYVFHDWPDDDCITILKHLHDAMGPNSRILTAD